MRAIDNNSTSPKDAAANAYADKKKKDSKRQAQGKKLKPKSSGERVMNYMNPTRNA